MPAMKELQFCNRRPNVAGTAHSYLVIVPSEAKELKL